MSGSGAIRRILIFSGNDGHRYKQAAEHQNEYDINRDRKSTRLNSSHLN